MKGRRIFLALVLVFFVLQLSVCYAQDKKFTEWGWPLPYEKVSQKSIDWLKAKGWWPLKISYQIDPLPFLAVEFGMLKARGIEAEAVPFLAGPAMLEALVAGQVVSVNAGNFPTTTMIDKNFETFGLSHYAFNWRHGTFAPKDSPIGKLTDLKLEKLGRAAIIGIPVGTSAEFYFRMSCQGQGIEIGKDVILKDMSGPDLLLMPKGIDAFACWEPWFYHPTVVQGKAKIIDVDWPYSMYFGYCSVRKDLLEVPDVVQAIADVYVEANLRLRYDPEEATKLCKEKHVNQKNYPWETLIHINSCCTFYKPTWLYVWTDFEAKEMAGIAKFLSETGRTKTLVTNERYKSYFRPEFVANSFKKLGWALHDVPPSIPKGWKGEPGKPPYPVYYHWPLEKTELGKAVELQPFPEPGDLTAPWYFKGKWYNP
jgi:ABC-type nitrate/sulfonate/bicarbonate transport system substrate-binding protein